MSWPAHVEAKAVRINGSVEWNSIRKYYTQQLQRFYIDNFLGVGWTFMRMMRNCAAKNERLRRIIAAHGMFRTITVHIVFDRESSFSDSSGKPKSNLLRKKAHFSLNPEPSVWWDQLNSDIASHAGFPGAEVVLVFLPNPTVPMSGSAGSLSSIFMNPFRKISARVYGDRPATSYHPVVIDRTKPKTTYLDADEASYNQTEILARAYADRIGISSELSDAAKKHQSLSQSNAPSAVVIEAHLGGDKEGKRTLRQQLKMTFGKPAPPAAAVVVAAPPPGQIRASYKKAPPAQRKWWFIREALSESIASELAEKVVQRSNGNSRPSLRQPLHRVQEAIESAINGKSSAGLYEKMGAADKHASFWKSAGVDDLPLLKQNLATHIASSLDTVNARYMSKNTAAQYRDKPDQLKEYAKSTYQKVLIQDNMLERISTWIDRKLYSSPYDDGGNDLGPTVGFSPWSYDAYKREKRWDSYRFAGWRPSDSTATDELWYLPPMQAHALGGSRRPVSLRPVVASTTSRPYVHQTIVVDQTRAHHKHSDSSDSEPNKHVHHHRHSSSSSSSSNSSSSSDEGKSTTTKTAVTTTVTSAPAPAVLVAPVKEEKKAVASVKQMNWELAKNFRRFFSEAYPAGSTKISNSVVMVPADEVFDAKLVEHVNGIVTSKESRGDAIRRFVDRYVCITEKHEGSVMTLKSIDGTRSYAVDDSRKMVVNSSKQSRCHVKKARVSIEYPGAKFYLSYVLHTDVIALKKSVSSKSV